MIMDSCCEFVDDQDFAIERFRSIAERFFQGIGRHLGIRFQYFFSCRSAGKKFQDKGDTQPSAFDI